MNKPVLFLLIITVISCSKENRWDCIKRTGKIVTEERNIDGFTDLEVNSNFNITIIKDNVNKVFIEAGNNLISLIKTDVTDGKLILKNNNHCNWARSYSKKINIIIHTKQINSIFVKDICKIQNSDTIKSDYFKIEVSQNVVSDLDLTMNCKDFSFVQHSGTGTYNFKGNTDNLYYYLKGTGYIFSNNLRTKTAQIVNKSTGDIHVNVLQKIYVEYTGSGDVYYSGNPSEITFDRTQSKGLLLKE